MFLPELYILPEELSLRDFSTSAIVGYGFFASFALISIAKLFRSDVYRMLFLSSFKVKSVDTFLKENFTLKSPESFILILNFFVSSSLILYILFDFPTVDLSQQFLFVIITPISLFIFSIVAVLFPSILFGEYKTIRQLMFFRIIGVQYLGIVFMILGVLWLLTNQSIDSFFVVVVVVTAIEFFIRVLKGLISVLQKKVPWYYIILYFCTLEILPFVIILYYLQGAFKLD